MQKTDKYLGYFHKEMAAGRWFEMDLIEQMANVGSEVSRSMNWKGKNDDLFWQAFVRLHELLQLTIDDQKNRSRRRELTRVREVLNDYFVGDNAYKSSDELWRTYFDSFAYAWRIRKDKQRADARDKR